MQNSLQSARSMRFVCVTALALLSLSAGCKRHPVDAAVQATSNSLMQDGVTEIAISDQVIQSGVKRFGINLGGQNYYDSGQMMRNLIATNPGFEGETWQTVLRCAGVSETKCQDANQWNQWPADFLKGATFQVISGQAAGTTGTVLGSTAANSAEKDAGVSITFAPMARSMDIDDFVIVKKTMPGNAQAGWGTSSWGGGAFSTEFKDLPPHTTGKQALRMSASQPDQGASLSGYFDSLKDHSFVQLHGKYRLQFVAKGIMGARTMKVTLERQSQGGGVMLFTKDVALTDSWKEYSFDFDAQESGQSVGTVALTFQVSGSEALLDDVSLASAERPAENPTAFRDEVVAALKELKPGILRYQDGGELGSSIDNLIAPPFARMRAGWSQSGKEQGEVPTGLVEFLELCKAVGAEPWFTMPGAMSQTEMKELVEFLGGPATSPYGAKRAARGQREPWTTVFPKIHLELGNEMWNSTTFSGQALPDPVVYGKRAKDIFLAARSVPGYDASKFDLVMGSFTLIPDWTKRELAASDGYDSTSVGGYLFGEMNDASSDEAIFGPMFAEPEMMDSRPKGILVQQAEVAKSAARPAKLTIYEENTGTAHGTASQEAFDRAVPSVGAGVALLDHMLLMVRDLGIKDQSVWALAGYQNGFENPETHAQETTPLYGTVVDMGGATNRKRPQFLAEALVNSAILPQMVATKVRGGNPVWQQAKSANGGGIELQDAHEVQSFAFADGKKRSLVVVNLSRTLARPMKFTGTNAPRGKVDVRTLTSDKITDGNEKQERVKVKPGVYAAGQEWEAPPFSLTVFTWLE